MKRMLVTAGVIAALGLQLIPAHAGGAEGSVLLPTTQIPAGIPAVAPGMVTRPARCSQVLGGPNGVFGYYTPIAPNQSGRPFTLSGSADFDIVFFSDLGTCENAPAPTALNDTAFIGDGDEAGTVPSGSRHALIVFEAAPPNQTFTFAIN